jgi:hypothetical protein
MRKSTLRIGGIGGIVAAASVALTLASVAPAFAGTVSAGTVSASTVSASTVSASTVSARTAAKTMTGPEAITGSAHGKAALANVTPIPLTLAGVVATTDHGFSLGPGGGNTHTLATPAGKLTVTGIGKQVNTQTLNKKTCYFTYTSRQQFKFVPGKSTGKFAGASGPGAYQIYFAAYAPRFTSGKSKGECNPNGQPAVKGAVATFLAAGVLTVNG